MSMWSVASGSGRRGRGRGEADIVFELDTMTTEDILRTLVDLKRETAYMQIESDYIERYLERNDPELLLGVTKMMQRAVVPADTRIQFAPNIDDQSGATNTSGGIDRHRKQSRGDGDNISIASGAMSFSSAYSGASMRTTDSLGVDAGVNLVMKNEMVEKDIAAFAAEIDKLREATKSELRDVTAEVEELRLSNDEAVETLAEFRDFVLIKGVQADTKRVPLERCLKFFDKWVIHGNGMIEQMRLRTATLKQDIKQKEKALAIKAELSGILLPVDFEQLEIERRAFMKTFAEKESHLLGLKRVTGNVSLALTTQRKLLERSRAKLASINRKMDVAKQETDRFDRIREEVETETDVWLDRVDRLRERRASYKAPSTMDYLLLQMRLQSLDREYKMLVRQETIARIKEKNVRSKAKRRRASMARREMEHGRIMEEAKRRASGGTGFGSVMGSENAELTTVKLGN